MQPDTAAIPHDWQDWLRLLVGGLLGYGATYLPSLLRRKQTAAEIERTKAETRQIDLSTTIQAGDVLLGLIDKVAVTTANVERMKLERDFWQNKAEALDAENKLIARQLDELIRIGKP